MTLGQETRWAYSTTLLSPRMSCLAKLSASQKVKDAVSKSVSEAQLTGLTCECSEMFSCVLDCKEWTHQSMTAANRIVCKTEIVSKMMTASKMMVIVTDIIMLIVLWLTDSLRTWRGVSSVKRTTAKAAVVNTQRWSRVISAAERSSSRVSLVYTVHRHWTVIVLHGLIPQCLLVSCHHTSA